MKAVGSIVIPGPFGFAQDRLREESLIVFYAALNDN
jgi:hypothetical protein